MITIIVIILLIILFFVFYRLKLKIKFKTFFKKGFKVQKGNWGVYCYVGKQGSGKTYSVVEFLKSLPTDTKIYTNMKSLVGIKYEYIDSFDELLKLRNTKDIVIVYDEIFTALSKSTKPNEEVMAFLSQMRKDRIVFITTAQEWLEINITFRRYVRFQIDCSVLPIYNFALLIKTFKNGEHMEWSNDANEYVAPLISTTISKMVLEVANAYDTSERIETSNGRIHRPARR